jgi:hypothetical protein
MLHVFLYTVQRIFACLLFPLFFFNFNAVVEKKKEVFLEKYCAPLQIKQTCMMLADISLSQIVTLNDATIVKASETCSKSTPLTNDEEYARNLVDRERLTKLTGTLNQLPRRSRAGIVEAEKAAALQAELEKKISRGSKIVSAAFNKEASFLSGCKKEMEFHRTAAERCYRQIQLYKAQFARDLVGDIIQRFSCVFLILCISPWCTLI